MEAFRREQTIVDDLNRGVSLAEIASRLGADERRLRIEVRDILTRRMPETAEEFAAIQASRLNEALLVAFSAMTDMNLKAVDRVLRIVRALDRYCGFSPASLPRLKTDAEAAAGAPGETRTGLGLGAGTSVGAGLGLGGGTGFGGVSFDGLGFGGLSFDVNKLDAALAALSRELGPAPNSPPEDPASADAPASDPRPADGAAAGVGRTIRDLFAQVLENMDSETEVDAALRPEAKGASGDEAQAGSPRADASPGAREDARDTRQSAPSGDESARIPAQTTEKARFTPGVAAAAAPRPVDRAGRPAVEAALRTPAPPPTRPLDRHGLSSLAMAAILSPAGRSRATGAPR